MEWVICNRVRVQYGTGIGFGYCKSGIGRFGWIRVRRYEMLVLVSD